MSHAGKNDKETREQEAVSSNPPLVDLAFEFIHFRAYIVIVGFNSFMPATISATICGSVHREDFQWVIANKTRVNTFNLNAHRALAVQIYPKCIEQYSASMSTKMVVASRFRRAHL